ncbi:MAG: helix-turn-helix transcriptional regulator [Clostridia bacterium]|nr:helix-turn-helix transcriptional regulator [Clostridia bacterium]
MDYIKTGNYIKSLRKSEGLTQKELAQKLGISFQAVSKWERGDTLPDTGLLLELCDILNTTADKLLNGGTVMFSSKKQMHMEDVIRGFDDIEDIGNCFGKDCDFFTGMVEGINSKMNIDLLEYMQSPKTREVLWAEVIIQGILSGKTVDMDEVEACFTNKKMIAEIRKYYEKTL